MSDITPRNAEIDAEQRYLDRAYARLDAMRDAARTVRDAYRDVRRGGTHQARLERDIAYDVTAKRLAVLEIGDAPLCFGRLDRDDATTLYIGRLGVDDEHYEPLVLDWRAPVAEPFYRATAHEPMGVTRRRHFLTREGRTLIDLDDEVFDSSDADDQGLEITGEGALMAALERDRTGRMGDIVATIQAEQDTAIRAGIAGPLLISGGPGTGKTAVALHRAAYLLYSHRERLAGNGVLLIGPSAVFLRYIEQVLPSLGEHDVALSTVSGLKPRLRVGAEQPDVAAVKGDARMAIVVRRALADRQRPLRDDLIVFIDGVRVVISPADSSRIVDGARRRPGPHNQHRPYVVRRLLDLLVGRWKRAAVKSYETSRLDRAQSGNVLPLADPRLGATFARGDAPPEGWEADMRRRFRTHPQVRAALNRLWPVISGTELINDLVGFDALLRSAAADVLPEASWRSLSRAWHAEAAAAPWTDADVALVDEADALLGPVSLARPRRRSRRGPTEEELAQASRVIEELDLAGSTDARTLAARFSLDEDAQPSDGAARTYGHVLVDEAQDLTAMQWRMLARRCPTGSMTVVGDPGQASRPGALAHWHRIVEHLPDRHVPREVVLSVNYRTPSEVMDIASRLLAVAAPDVDPSRSVRSTGEQPTFTRVEGHALVRAVEAAVRVKMAQGGKIAVIAPDEHHAAVLEALDDVDVAAGNADALDARVGVLNATDAKGLEFDHVVVVEPAKLVTPDRPGLRLLYVTVTRATKTLTVVHAEALPEGLVAPPA